MNSASRWNPIKGAALEIEEKECLDFYGKGEKVDELLILMKDYKLLKVCFKFVSNY